MANNIQIPEHIAIIMDGNRRWAKEHNVAQIVGHKKGAEALGNLIKEADKLGLKYMTVYAFSTENWNRDKNEVDSLMNLFREYLSQSFEGNIRVIFIGEKHMLADEIVAKMNKLEIETAKNTGMTLCVSISYGSRQEIIHAVKRTALMIKNGDISIEDIDENLFSSMLYTSKIPDPDLLIRTSGEKRLSNYLLWQSAYTELYFTDTLWPDFTIDELKMIIKNFSLRERRYGKN